MDLSDNNLKKPGSILIAEDDYINFLLLEELLSKNNYKVIRAMNGKEVVEIMNSVNDVKMVLMDIKMPYLDGFEVLEILKKKHPDIPVIAQTAYALHEDRVKIEEAGFNYYFTKPINNSKLLELVREIFKE